MFWMPCQSESSRSRSRGPRPNPGSREYFRADGRDYRIRPAQDLRTRKAAFELVHDLYVEKGFTEPHDGGMWLSVANLHPDTVTLVVERGDEIVGTLTAVFDSELGLPADLLYRNHVGSLRQDGRSPAEIISLGVAEEGAKASRQILVKLFDFVYTAAWNLRGATDFVITVNPHHADYYRRTLLFEQIGGFRHYGKVGGAPAVLLNLPLEIPTREVAGTRLERLKKRTLYRYIHTTAEEKDIISYLETRLEPMTEAEFLYFAINRSDVWKKATHAEKTYLSGHYLAAMLAMEEVKHLVEPPSGPTVPAGTFTLVRGGAV